MSTTEHERFTDITWKQAAPNGYLCRSDRERADGWMAQHDLAVEMAEGGMDFELARLLVSAVLNGMPIVVKWRGRTTEVLTETVIVDYLAKTHGDGQGLMHVRKWGGAHPIYYGEIVAAGTPDTVFEFDVHDQHHTIRHPAFGEEEHTTEGNRNDEISAARGAALTRIRKVLAACTQEPVSAEELTARIATALTDDAPE